MTSRFVVEDKHGRTVEWSSGVHSWRLHGRRIDGHPGVELTRDGEFLAILTVGEARDLSRALDLLLVADGDRTDGQDRPPAPRKAQAGNPWTDQADETLRQRWRAGALLVDLTHEFQRTRGAIEARIVRLGLSESREQVKRDDRRRRAIGTTADESPSAPPATDPDDPTPY